MVAFRNRQLCEGVLVALDVILQVLHKIYQVSVVESTIYIYLSVH